MESIQELLRKLCKCIIKSDDGYKINIKLEKSDPEPEPGLWFGMPVSFGFFPGVLDDPGDRPAQL